MLFSFNLLKEAGFFFLVLSILEAVIGEIDPGFLVGLVWNGNIYGNKCIKKRRNLRHQKEESNM